MVEGKNRNNNNAKLNKYQMLDFLLRVIDEPPVGHGNLFHFHSKEIIEFNATVELHNHYIYNLLHNIKYDEDNMEKEEKNRNSYLIRDNTINCQCNSNLNTEAYTDYRFDLDNEDTVTDFCNENKLSLIYCHDDICVENINRPYGNNPNDEGLITFNVSDNKNLEIYEYEYNKCHSITFTTKNVNIDSYNDIGFRNIFEKCEILYHKTFETRVFIFNTLHLRYAHIRVENNMIGLSSTCNFNNTRKNLSEDNEFDRSKTYGVQLASYIIPAIYAYVYQYRHHSGTLITTMTAYIANINLKTISKLLINIQGFMTNICSKPCVDISILSEAYINKCQNGMVFIQNLCKNGEREDRARNVVKLPRSFLSLDHDFLVKINHYSIAVARCNINFKSSIIKFSLLNSNNYYLNSGNTRNSLHYFIYCHDFNCSIVDPYDGHFYTHNKICGISESEDHKKYLCISPTMMKKELKYHKL
ncbi:hypothetical protein H8356DRAFT_1343667 [Neocallimastix lanati (nom. inval.)]|nr:hypothetical protein H8356DRAFT_1343667 [Neocallimastix sp. JGI-2020a]